MMGKKGPVSKPFYEFSLDRRVPENHLLRRIEAHVDFGFVYPLTQPFYSYTGRPSMDPVVLFKMALLGYLYGLPRERRLAHEVELNLAYRWLLGYDLDEATPNHSGLSKVRRRFGPAVYEEFSSAIVGQCEQAGLSEGTTAFLDSTLVPARASKSSRFRALVQRLPGRSQDVVRQLWEENPANAANPVASEGDGFGGPVNHFAVSRTDPEAGLVTRPPGAPRFAYKDHCCVDGGAARIVTAVKVTPGYAPDEHQLSPLLEAHASLLSRVPRRVAPCTKYGTRANYRYYFERGIARSIRMAQLPEKVRGCSTDACHYDSLRDVYRCPTRQLLRRRVEAKSSDAVIYRAEPASRRACPV